MCLCINWTITTPIDTPKGVFLVNYTFSNEIHLQLPFSDAKLEHRLISESLAGPVTREREQSQQGGCPRSRRVLSAGQDSSLHCPSLSDWQWHHDISCPDARWRRPSTLAYLRSSQHLLSSLHPHTDPSLRCRRDVPRLMMQILYAEIQPLQKSLAALCIHSSVHNNISV